MDALTAVNVLTSALLSALAAWAVMSHAVRDGIVIKLGLIALSMGHAMAALHLVDGITCEDLIGLNRARFVGNLGLLVVLAGYALRRARGEQLHDVLPLIGGARREDRS